MGSTRIGVFNVVATALLVACAPIGSTPDQLADIGGDSSVAEAGQMDALVSDLALIGGDLPDGPALNADAAADWPALNADAAADGPLDLADLAIEAPDAQSCPEPPAQAPLGGTLLADTVNGPPIEAGGALGADVFMLFNLDGDERGDLELLIGRAGRLEARRSDGRLLWQTEAFGLRFISGVADLDGDGRAEIIARAARHPGSVRLFDATSGVERWQFPAQPFLPLYEGPVGAHRVLVRDVDGDGRPNLIISDTGCSGAGSGLTAIYDFARVVDGDMDGRFDDVAPPVIVSPGTRCGRWQTHGHFDDDGLPEVVYPRATSVAIVDPRTGLERTSVELGRNLGNAFLHRLADLDGDGRAEIIGLFGSELLVLGLNADTDLLELRFATRVGQIDAQLGAIAVTNVDDLGARDLVVSGFDAATNLWTTYAVSGDDGTVRFSRPDSLLMGLVEGDGDPSTVELLLREGERLVPEALGRHTLTGLAPLAFVDLWSREAAATVFLRRDVFDSEVTVEARQVAAVDGRVWLVSHDPQSLEVTGFEAIDGAGESARFPLSEPPGAMDVECGETCIIAASLSDGSLAFLDGNLQLLNAGQDGLSPSVRLSAGGLNLVAAPGPDGLIVLAVTPAGKFGRLRLTPSEPDVSPFEWSTALGTTSGRSLLLPAPGSHGLVVRRNVRVPGELAWDAFDVQTGQLVWRSALPVDYYRGGNDAVEIDADLDGLLDVVRLDVSLDPLESEPACAARIITGRTYTAVHGRTGASLWQVTLRPGSPCTGNDVGRVSAADGDGDGVAELYITETSTLRRLDPTTGAELSRVDLDPHPSAIRTGGVVIATGLAAAPLLRVGGNGPIEARDLNLQLVWRADPALSTDVRTWTDRPALVVGAEVWVSPAIGLPTERLALDGPNAGLSVGRIDVSRGQVRVAMDALVPTELTGWQAIEDLQGDGRVGLLASGDDGFLDAFDPDGILLWSRDFGAPLGKSVVGDLDGDGQDELLASLTNGTLIIADRLALPPPPLAWDLPCPPRRSCDPADDIDVSGVRDALCFAFYPTLGGRDGEPALEVHHLARPVGPNEAALTDWQDADTNEAVVMGGLTLEPGSSYCVEVRAMGIDPARPAHPVYSSPTLTDCVRIIDETPPEVELRIADPVLDPGDPPMLLVVSARDEQGLAGWSLELRSLDDQPIALLASGPAQGQNWLASRFFRGLDGSGKALRAGSYVIVATAVDRAGSRATDHQQVEVVAPGP